MGESSVTGAGQAGIGAGLEWLGRKAGFCLCRRSCVLCQKDGSVFQ